MIGELLVHDPLIATMMVIQEPNKSMKIINFRFSTLHGGNLSMNGNVITKQTAVKQQMGTMAQMNDTCRQHKIEPKLDTKHIPTLNEMLDIVIITPRTDGSLRIEATKKKINFALESSFSIEFHF